MFTFPADVRVDASAEKKSQKKKQTSLALHTRSPTDRNSSEIKSGWSECLTSAGVTNNTVERVADVQSELCPCLSKGWAAAVWSYRGALWLCLTFIRAEFKLQGEGDEPWGETEVGWHCPGICETMLTPSLSQSASFPLLVSSDRHVSSLLCCFCIKCRLNIPVDCCGLHAVNAVDVSSLWGCILITTTIRPFINFGL